MCYWLVVCWLLHRYDSWPVLKVRFSVVKYIEQILHRDKKWQGFRTAVSITKLHVSIYPATYLSADLPDIERTGSRNYLEPGTRRQAGPGDRTDGLGR